MLTENLTVAEENALLKFGKNVRNEYYIDPSVTFCNHGGLGRSPKSIIKRKQELEVMMASSPDAWFRIKSYKFWNDNRIAMASYLNVEEGNILLCKNSTDAINSILKSITFSPYDAILVTEYTYQPVLNAIDYVTKYRLEECNHIKVFKLPISFPIKSVDEILKQFDQLCEKIVNEHKLNLKLAVIDHISSSIAIMYPVKDICKIIRRWNDKGIILIDGAHAIGQIPIRLNELDCDFYVSSLHKWFLSPHGCSFLYFKESKLVESLEPNYISYGYKRSVFVNFKQRASEDMTSMFVVQECIDFYENKFGGLTNIITYCTEILEKAERLLVDGWETCSLDVPKEMKASLMRIVKLPKLKTHINDYNKLTNYILENHNLMAYIVKIGSDACVRISCFVYNDLDDYIKLRDTINYIKLQDLSDI